MQAYRAAAFSLAVENTRDNSNNLYLDTSNTLSVTATSDGGLVMADQSAYFVLDFGIHFPPTAWDGVLPSATGLTAALVSPAHPTRWKFTPISIPWTVPATLSLTMPGILPATGNSPPTTPLTFSWFGLQGTDDDGRTVRLDVVPSPNPALQELALVVEWWDLNSSGTGAEVQPINLSTGEFAPISNTVAFVIMNPSESLPVVGTPGAQPNFWFTFNTVESEGDPGAVDALCTLQQADQITAKAMVGESAWSAAQNPDANLNWQLLPPTNVLGPGESIIIEIANIISYLPAYATALYVNWSDVPGYNDGGQTLIIQKRAAPPTVASFTYAGPDPAGITMGQQVTLSWDTFGSRQPGPVNIYLRDTPSTHIVTSGDAVGNVIVIAQAPITYMIALSGIPAIPLFVPVQAVTLSALTVSPQQSSYNFGDSVALNADIQFAQSYSIAPAVLGPVSVMGSTVVSQPVTLASGVDSFTLTATGYQGPVSARCDIAWNLQIVRVSEEFDNGPASLQFSAINGVPPLVWQIDDSTLFSMTSQGLLTWPNEGPRINATFAVTVTTAQGKSKTMVCNSASGYIPSQDGSYWFWFTQITGMDQVGLDIQSSNTYFSLPAGIGMMLREPVAVETNLYALNVMLSDKDGTAQGTPVAIVYDRTVHSDGGITFSVSQTSAVLNFNPQSYAIQRLTLATSLTVQVGQVIAIVNSGPNTMYLSWVDGPEHHVWNSSVEIPPLPGYSVTSAAGDLGYTCASCGWNFTGEILG